MICWFQRAFIYTQFASTTTISAMSVCLFAFVCCCVAKMRTKVQAAVCFFSMPSLILVLACGYWRLLFARLFASPSYASSKSCLLYFAETFFREI